MNRLTACPYSRIMHDTPFHPTHLVCVFVCDLLNDTRSLDFNPFEEVWIKLCAVVHEWKHVFSTVRNIFVSLFLTLSCSSAVDLVWRCVCALAMSLGRFEFVEWTFDGDHNGFGCNAHCTKRQIKADEINCLKSRKITSSNRAKWTEQQKRH